jgi:hypothetical protein
MCRRKALLAKTATVGFTVVETSATAELLSQPRGRKNGGYCMARRLTFAAAGLTALSATAPGLAAAEPIDLLAPAVTARLNDTAPSDTRSLMSATAPVRTSAPSAPAQAMFTNGLMPGHWQLEGARYLWVPPETVPRPVEYRPFIGGRYVWRGGEWVWVPAHWGK